MDTTKRVTKLAKNMALLAIEKKTLRLEIMDLKRKKNGDFYVKDYAFVTTARARINELKLRISEYNRLYWSKRRAHKHHEFGFGPETFQTWIKAYKLTFRYFDNNKGV